MWVNFLSNSSIPEYKTLSARTKIPYDWGEYKNLVVHGLIGNGTHTIIDYGISPSEAVLSRWWNGNLVQGNIPYVGFFSDKKRNLNEASKYIQLHNL